VTFLILLALLTTTHYNRAGNVALLSMMVVLAFGLVWDIRRRRTQWRS
jgi:NADH:ubiquinone oxidoreductase subunit 3 (subunit A)